MASKYDIAVYTINQMISDLYITRSSVDITFHKFTHAAANADKAIELNPAGSDAYLNKGMANIFLEDYETAKAALEMGASLASKNKAHDFDFWIQRCDKLRAEQQQQEQQSGVGVIATEEKTTTEGVATQDAQPENNVPLKYSISSVLTHASKAPEVVDALFANDIPRDNITVDFSEEKLKVTIDVPDDDKYTYSVFEPHLFGKIIPDKCEYKVTFKKIEIHLAKAESIQWTSLESNSVAGVERQNVEKEKVEASPPLM